MYTEKQAKRDTPRGHRKWSYKTVGLSSQVHVYRNLGPCYCNSGLSSEVCCCSGLSWQVSLYHRPCFMPQSHCAESTPEWGRIDNSSLFEWSFPVIPGHSSNDNDNQFEQCSSRLCSFSRSVRNFWTCSKSLCTQRE